MQMMLIKHILILTPLSALVAFVGWDSSIIGLLVMGCIIGIPGVMAWAGSSERGLPRIFQTGPALLIPAVFLWTLISHFSCPGEVECRHDLWRVLPFYAAIGVALFWHIALIRNNRNRMNFYIPYAFLFLPAFYLYCMIGLVFATRFPL
jgi:hypothetical protein